MADLINGLGGPAGFGPAASFGRNDDAVTPRIDLSAVFGTGLNYFGRTFTSLFVSNNGRVTFESADGSFTPTAIVAATNNPQIAVFFADVDTRLPGSTIPAPTPGGTSTGSDLVYVATDTAGDRVVFTWDDVGYFSSSIDKLNAFQLILTDTSRTGSPGDFDITFRYEAINWTTGNASGGSGGLGGTVARAGYSAGTGRPGEFFELPASGNQQAILDLESNPGNTGQPGLWNFSVRGGVVRQPDGPGPNPNPLPSEDEFAIVQGSSLTLPLKALVANDGAAAGVTLQVAALSPASVGSVAMAPEERFTYTPPAGFVGRAEFSYTSESSAGATDTRTVGVAVLSRWGSGDAPTSAATEAVVAAPTSVAAPASSLLGRGGFDRDFYLSTNSDVARAGVDPRAHYDSWGFREGRDPNRLFDTSEYLRVYADVRAAGVNPLDHYERDGFREGRDPSAGFDTSAYLAAYRDVAAAGINPLAHYLQYGAAEGRLPFGDGILD